MRRGTLGAVVAGALVLTMTAISAPAFAKPTLDLRLDDHAAGRLLAASPETGNATGDEKAKSDGTGDAKSEKSDEVKLTLSKGTPKPEKTGSDDTFAFVKDWPFWAIVGGVVVVGASVYMINRNNSQDTGCPVVYNAGCFGAK